MLATKKRVSKAVTIEAAIACPVYDAQTRREIYDVPHRRSVFGYGMFYSHIRILNVDSCTRFPVEDYNQHNCSSQRLCVQ